MADILEELKQAIIDGDDEAAVAKAEQALKEGIKPLNVLNKAIVPGIERSGQLWQDNVHFLPDVVLSAEAFKAAMKVVEPHLAGEKVEKRGKVVIGGVAGDMHDLGKSIVTAMLTGAGFDVLDLGVDVPTETFVQKVQQLKPNILGLGCYMSTTMLLIPEVIKALEQNKLRDKVKVMVGGVPTTQEFADEVRADAWGKDALDAVVKANQLMEVR